MNPLRSTHFQKVQQKRYAERSFRNPYFQPKGRPRWLAPLIGIVAAAGIGTGLWFLFTLPALAITAVHVEGNETIATGALVSAVQAVLDERVLWAFRRSNRFLFDGKKLTAALNGQFAFDSVNVTRAGGTLDVRVRERQSQLLWKSGTGVDLVDASGQVIRPLSADEIAGLGQPDPAPGPGETLAPVARLKRLRVFNDVDKAPVAASVLSAKEVAGALSFEQRLLDQAIPFTRVDVDRQAGAWMAVKTLTGYDILFDPLGDVDGQAARLAALFRDAVKDQKPLTYVDLRFGDHVYYK